MSETQTLDSVTNCG